MIARPSPRVAIVSVLAAVLVVWLLFWAWPRWAAREQAQSEAAAAAAAAAGRRITATLFYVAPDGQSLASITREVPYGATATEQARHILDAQLQAPPASHFSALPEGTRVLGVFVSDAGEAFVDFGPEIAANHRGGSLSELLTVYTIVNAITASLPAVRTVQILIDGREVETLAGHVDLRHPLPADTTWVTSQ